MSRLIQPWETPYVRAVSDWEVPARTAVITRRRFDELEEFDMAKPVEAQPFR